MTDTKKPLACPLCGAELSFDYGFYQHPENGCVFELKIIYPFQIEAWNTRTTDPVILELVELVDKYCEGPALVAMPFVKFRDKYRDILSRLPERYKQ